MPPAGAELASASLPVAASTEKTRSGSEGILVLFLASKFGMLKADLSPREETVTNFLSGWGFRLAF
jgi:hypothetical protein